jgi:hypothetical protein
MCRLETDSSQYYRNMSHCTMIVMNFNTNMVFITIKHNLYIIIENSQLGFYDTFHANLQAK